MVLARLGIGSSQPGLFVCGNPVRSTTPLVSAPSSISSTAPQDHNSADSFINIPTCNSPPLADIKTMALLEISILDQLAQDVASLPDIQEKQLANLYGMSLRDIRDIIHSEMFLEKVAEIRKANPDRAAKPLKEKLLDLGELSAVSRLVEEVDNSTDGTPVSRIAAAKEILNVRAQKNNGAFLAVELSPDKFRAIFGMGPIAPQPASVFG
jgi:hypothetical protein